MQLVEQGGYQHESSHGVSEVEKKRILDDCKRQLDNDEGGVSLLRYLMPFAPKRPEILAVEDLLWQRQKQLEQYKKSLQDQRDELARRRLWLNFRDMYEAAPQQIISSLSSFFAAFLNVFYQCFLTIVRLR